MDKRLKTNTATFHYEAPILRGIFMKLCGRGILAEADTLDADFDKTLMLEHVCTDSAGVAVFASAAEATIARYIDTEGKLPQSVGISSGATFIFEPLPKRLGSGSMAGKVVIVTGGAQGFGEGLVRGFAESGAYVTIADMNEEGAMNLSESLNVAGSAGTISVRTDVTDEDSVRGMVTETVKRFGGLDVMIANAGIATAGGLDTMDQAAFEAVTSVNYTGYFFCAKYAAGVMKLQHLYAQDKMFDIININSKSGLEGSKANFAYSGSKFGSIGLTQSFALELAEYGIKVNAICPGNLFDGPLWSDPEHGLFQKYLEAGKVPGAGSVGDVRKYYESKIPLGRGCKTIDVMRAAEYIVLQQYETGQAVPVTGGQVMLG